MKNLKKFSQNQQLNAVNHYLNQLLPQYDAVINKKDDNWATPKEFLTIGYGDCEDYALIKYYSLIKLGFDEKKLFITVVKEKFKGGQHMVLTYFQYKNRAPFVLDNLSFKILDLKKREDLNAQLFINSTGVYKPAKNFHLIKVAHKYQEFEELKEKVKNNH
ncbi:MAG: transglutaminase-like cysteine peptidase [Sulfurimonas sp.]